MKAIIDGKRYDTETAEELAGCSNTNDYGDFRHEGYKVYRTPKGNYFMHYWGGPLSSYATKHGDEYRGDEGLRPLDNQEARELLEGCGRDGATALEKYFPIEDA
jgi:hypothetical protein